MVGEQGLLTGWIGRGLIKWLDKNLVMSKWIISLVLVGVSAACTAQTFAEWFEQNKTRLAYYEEQILALKTYTGYAEKGYSIVESGLNTIKGIKSGEFNLHTAFYNSLQAIHPAIGNMGEVLEIVALQAAIVERFSASLSRYRQNAALHADEVTYLGNAYSLLLSDGLADINALIDIITANTLKMTDDEREARIHELDRTMKDRYSFTAAFTDQADWLSLQRQSEGVDLGTVRGLYGIP